MGIPINELSLGVAMLDCSFGMSINLLLTDVRNAAGTAISPHRTVTFPVVALAHLVFVTWRHCISTPCPAMSVAVQLCRSKHTAMDGCTRKQPSLLAAQTFFAGFRKRFHGTLQGWNWIRIGNFQFWIIKDPHVPTCAAFHLNDICVRSLQIC